MAIEKSIKTKFGAPATYWKITHRQEQCGVGVMATLHGYADRATADNKEGLALEKMDITIQGDDYKADMTIKDLYTVITETVSQFKGGKEI